MNRFKEGLIAELDRRFASRHDRMQEAIDRMPVCDCIASGHTDKPKQHGADPHAKNCAVYLGKT